MPKKQKSGLYRTKIKIGVDEAGNDVVKWISGKTKRELEEARNQAMAYYIGCEQRQPDRLFGEYALEWYAVRKRPFISPSQQNAYRTMLNKHVLPEFGDRNLRAITAADLQRFVNRFESASKSQIIMALAVLRGILGAAYSDRILDADPTARLRRPSATPPREKRALTAGERERIEHVISTEEGAEYLALLYYTGMRPGEVRGLQWGDIDWDANMIHVQRDLDFVTGEYGSLKTHAADRLVPLVAPLREFLAPRRDMPAVPVVRSQRGTPISQASAIRLWLRLMHAAGLTEPVAEGETNYARSDIKSRLRATVTPHVFRHNFITMCYDAGMDVQLVAKIVGHADVRVTMAIYTHLDQSHVARAADQLQEIFAPSKKVAQKLHKDSPAVIPIKRKKA